jgi:hypothetical protein
MNIRRSPFAQSLCSRLAGIVWAALAGMLVLLIGLDAALAHSNPRDPRLSDKRVWDCALP